MRRLQKYVNQPKIAQADHLRVPRAAHQVGTFLFPCIAASVNALLHYYGVECAGKSVVILGNSYLVGEASVSPSRTKARHSKMTVIYRSLIYLLATMQSRISCYAWMSLI